MSFDFNRLIGESVLDHIYMNDLAPYLSLNYSSGELQVWPSVLQINFRRESVGTRFVVRDEAWALMTNQKQKNVMIESLRTARKNGFSTISKSKPKVQKTFAEIIKEQCVQDCFQKDLKVVLLCSLVLLELSPEIGDRDCRLIFSEEQSPQELLHRLTGFELIDIEGTNPDNVNKIMNKALDFSGMTSNDLYRKLEKLWT